MPQSDLLCRVIVFEVGEDFFDHCGIFDSGDRLDSAAELLAGFDLEHVPSSEADGEAFVP